MASLLERATIGFFLLFAAIHFRSSEAKGFAGAIRVIQQQPYGSALLAITAAGLLAFGLYGFAEAAFRRITPQAVHLKANRIAPPQTVSASLPPSNIRKRSDVIA